MKKISLLIFSLIICVASIFGGSVCYAGGYALSQDFVATDFNLTQEETRNTLIKFVYGEDAITSSLFDDTGARVNRTAGTDNEKVAAQYLLEQLKSVLNVPVYQEGEEVDTTKNEAQLQEFKFSNGIKEYTSQNVVGLLKATNQSDKFLIIGAHYDNYYGYSSNMFGNTATKSHGIYDNASGVTALIETAKILQLNIDSLQYNVMFVFYGAEEQGMFGSRYFYGSLTKAVKDNILLAVNLDSIGAGDEMYMYADEVSTLHQDYFKEVADNLYTSDADKNVYFNLPPKNKKVDYMSKLGNFGYAHMGLASDNVTYVSGGVNSITFFSSAWANTNKLGMVESSTNANIMHTSNDSLVKVEELYGDVFYKRINSAVNLVCNAVLEDDFVQTMINSENTKSKYLFFVNPTYIKIIIISIVVITCAIFMFVIRKHKPAIATTDPNLEKLKRAVVENKLNEVGEVEIISKETVDTQPEKTDDEK